MVRVGGGLGGRFQSWIRRTRKSGGPREGGPKSGAPVLVFRLCTGARARHGGRTMMLVKTRVAPSGIHGNGLFAAESIRAGTPIWRFAEGFDHELTPSFWAGLPEPARAHARGYCFVIPGSLHLVKSGDHACFMNHSPNPNTGALPGATEPVTTVALRDIAEGEELTCDYRAFDADVAWKLGEVPSDSPLGA